MLNVQLFYYYFVKSSLIKLNKLVNLIDARSLIIHVKIYNSLSIKIKKENNLCFALVTDFFGDFSGPRPP